MNRQEDGFTYDSSMTSLEYGYLNMANGRWPHTLDYAYEPDMDCPVLYEDLDEVSSSYGPSYGSVLNVRLSFLLVHCARLSSSALTC